MTATIDLPRIHRGIPREVTPANRSQYGLSAKETIVEIVGDQKKLLEAVAYCRSKKRCGFDLETSGLNPFTDRIILVQLGDEERQYIIWYETIDSAPISELLLDKAVCKVGVNLKFDLCFWLAKHGLSARAWNVADAMLVEQIIGCGLFSEADDNVGATLVMTSMDQMARRWLGIMLPKDEETRTGWGDMAPGVWFGQREEYESDEAFNEAVRKGTLKRHYAADDVIVPLKLLDKQKGWLRRLGLVKTIQLEHYFLPVLAEMEIRGLKLDEKAWRGLAEAAEKKTSEAQRKLDVIFDVTTSVRVDEDGNAVYERDKLYTSSTQLKDLIREYMWKHHSVDLIITNKHFKESLERVGRVTQARLDKVFEKREVPNPKKPGTKKRAGYPDMSDLIEPLWPIYSGYLEDNAVVLPSTDSKVLKFFRIIFTTPPEKLDPLLPNTVGLPPRLVDPILTLRKYSKQSTTYGKNWFSMIERKTGRIHCRFVQGALTTGRLSSRPNFQNLPTLAAYRAAFIAEKGYKYVSADWSQIEPRIIAQLSKEPSYMRVFWSERPDSAGYKKWCRGVTEKLDLYTEIGKMCGVIPPHYTVLDTKGNEEKGIEPKPDGERGRKEAKIIVLGLGYGTGREKFWKTLMIDTKQHHPRDYSDQLHSRFWRAANEMKKTLNEFSRLASPEKSDRKIFHPFANTEVTWSETIGGRKRFFKPTAKAWWTCGRNHPVQGCGSDIMKETAVQLMWWAWANNIEGGLVNLIHDEIIFEAKEKDTLRVKEKMQELMQVVGEGYCPDVPISADAKITDFWKK